MTTKLIPAQELFDRLKQDPAFLAVYQSVKQPPSTDKLNGYAPFIVDIHFDEDDKVWVADCRDGFGFNFYEDSLDVLMEKSKKYIPEMVLLFHKIQLRQFRVEFRINVSCVADNPESK